MSKTKELKYEDIEYLNKEFPKGKTKFRGQAMVLLALARKQGKQKLINQWKSDIGDAYDSGKQQILQEVEKIIDGKELLENLADLEHQQFSHLVLYIFNTLLKFNKKDFQDKLEQWKLQSQTPYKELLEAHKEKDRIWAKKVIEELKKRIEQK